GRRDAPEYAADGSRIYHDRIIDIDILLYGDMKVDEPGLTIPHPQLDTRPFFGDLIAQVRRELDTRE
nr:2-amino-4-hydroxy-6-hydroxymethyldihydropteridine diphosphokinase [Bacteroidales bacterium]